MLNRIFSLTLLLAFFPSTAFASLVWTWQMGPAASFPSADEIVLRGTLFNKPSSTLNLTDDLVDSVSNNGAEFIGLWSFEFGPGPGPFTFFSQFAGMNLAPGESFDFIVGRLTPSTAIPDGIYHADSELEVANRGISIDYELTVNNGTVFYSATNPANALVPIPAGIWLFISGLVCMFYAARNK